MEYIYAALLLHKLGKDVSEESLRKLISSAGATVDDSKIKSLVASLKGVNISKELENASFVSAPASGSAPAKEPEKEKPAEEKKEAAAEGLSALFG